ncbi:MAG: glutathione S-transferase family protein [Pseudomonadales bacterium]|nr:glutathione S-transferase family protein [Pseudomonadales bacterium]
MSEQDSGGIEALCRTISGLNEQSVSKPTLVYFDIIGIAWPIRCALHLAGVDHDLIQISIGEWSQRDSSGAQVVKRCFRNGHVPLYVDQDVYLNQSTVIMDYLATKHDLAGDHEKERRAIAEVCAHAYDALFHWSGLLQIIIKRGIPDDVVEARKEAYMGRGVWGVATGGFAGHLDGFVRYLEANPSRSGYFVGNRLSMADLHAFNVLCNWYKAFAPETFSGSYPQLDAFIHRIAATPRVKDYIDNLQEPTTWFNLPQIAIRLTSPEELQGLVSGQASSPIP